MKNKIIQSWSKIFDLKLILQPRINLYIISNRSKDDFYTAPNIKNNFVLLSTIQKNDYYYQSLFHNLILLKTLNYQKYYAQIQS